MSASPAERHPGNPFLHFALIPGVSEHSLLLMHSREGWTLPCVRTEARTGDRIGALNRAFHERIGLEVTVLRRVDERERSTFYEMECHGPVRTPSAGRWVHRDELD